MKYSYYTYLLETRTGSVWVAESLALKGCVGQGEDISSAVRELEANELEWLYAATKSGIDIPEEPVNTYSGKISLRIEPSEHRKAAIRAKLEGISLNQYMCDAIIAKNSGRG